MEKDFRRMGRAELLDALNAALRERDAREKELTDSARKAEIAAQHLEKAEERLRIAENELLAARGALAAQQKKNASLNAQLESANAQLESTRGQLICAQEALDESSKQAGALAGQLRDEQNARALDQEKISSLTQQLSDRVILKDNAGSLADAAIQINGVLSAAQTAADQYLENIERLHREQEKSCALMEAESREKAAQMIREAESRCAALEEQTRAKCAALKADAEKNVWQKWSSLSEQLKQISNEIHNTVHVPD